MKTYSLVPLVLALLAAHTGMAQAPATLGNANAYVATERSSYSSNNYNTTRYEANNQVIQRQAPADNYERNNVVPPVERPATMDHSGFVPNSTRYQPAYPPQNYERAILSGTGKTLAEHRAVNDNAYGAASGNGFINPGKGTVSPRYNRVTGRYYYYCTSEETRRKCYDTCKAGLLNGLIAMDGNSWTDRDFDRRYLGYSMYIVYGLMNNGYVSRDMLLMSDNTSKHSNSAQFFSFDGLIVYNTDTIRGVVTITGNQVSLEHHGNNGFAKLYSATLSNPALKAIVMYKGIKELHLVRLSPTDKHLSRLVHNGKLQLYDRSYSFLTADNISNKLVAIAGTNKETIKGHRELAEAVNKTYGLNINHEETSKQELIKVINRLD